MHRMCGCSRSPQREPNLQLKICRPTPFLLSATPYHTATQQGPNWLRAQQRRATYAPRPGVPFDSVLGLRSVRTGLRSVLHLWPALLRCKKRGRTPQCLVPQSALSLQKPERRSRTQKPRTILRSFSTVPTVLYEFEYRLYSKLNVSSLSVEIERNANGELCGGSFWLRVEFRKLTDTVLSSVCTVQWSTDYPLTAALWVLEANPARFFDDDVITHHGSRHSPHTSRGVAEHPRFFGGTTREQVVEQTK